MTLNRMPQRLLEPAAQALSRWLALPPETQLRPTTPAHGRLVHALAEQIAETPELCVHADTPVPLRWSVGHAQLCCHACWTVAASQQPVQVTCDVCGDSLDDDAAKAGASVALLGPILILAVVCRLCGEPPATRGVRRAADPADVRFLLDSLDDTWNHYRGRSAFVKGAPRG